MTMEIKPTRIVKEPQWGPGSGSKKIRWFPCDDGREYTAPQLSEITGLAISTIYNRLAAHGWDSPLILRNNNDGKRRQYVKRPDSYNRRRRPRSIPEQAEWDTMGTKPRVENFKRIRPMGTFERQELGL